LTGPATAFRNRCDEVFDSGLHLVAQARLMYQAPARDGFSP
jgi:hypothetical protein